MEAPQGKRYEYQEHGLKIFNFLPTAELSPWEVPEPRWVPDGPNCSRCSKGFGFFKLTFRHHCRRCGNLFCGDCTEAR